ncbi:hypothetical protein GGS21DRAFT_284415 [Xylaria nigripes]|nr:hypothetical protein GGS21DRAFT_284415 [Xylaria nigripes]
MAQLTRKHPVPNARALHDPRPRNPNPGLTHAIWVEHLEVSKPEILAPILESVLGGPATEKALLEAPTTQGKETLTTNTDRAIATGGFGVPWMVRTNAGGGRDRGVLGLRPSRPSRAISGSTDARWKSML